MPAAFFGGIGIWEIMLILIVALIVFGNRLPEIARQVGKGYLEFKKGLRSLEDEIQYTEATPVPPPGGPGKKPPDSGRDAAGPAGAGPGTPGPEASPDGREPGATAGDGGATAPDPARPPGDSDHR